MTPILLTTIVLGPLFGALACGFGHRFVGEKAAMIVAATMIFVAAILSWIVFVTFSGDTESVRLLRFFDSGSMTADWSIRLDRLTSIMLVVVTTVSALVHLYSFGYMHADPQWSQHESYQPRFFAYLSFFSFSMLVLVSSDNLLQLFFGWEGVGVASYLLIGFYYRKSTANAAAMKAFIVNRVGDFGLALGIFALFLLTDSVQFPVIFAAAETLASTRVDFLWMELNAAELTASLLFVGACGKSAQLFLHTWLPDAMEGPTPVSALIHAATMVTAGVFLVCRFSPLFEFAPTTLAAVTVIGASTAFFAATIGLVQNDIKRVIAYSTCSQLGYMFAAAGVGVYQAAMFHLFTHAFFKALLFLGAGSVIHAMHHEQDMRKYGGLRHKIPWTFWCMVIGTLAITGVGIPLTYYGFAGFLSKDAVIESTFAAATGPGGFAFWLLLVAALMTSFYSWRLIFLTFFGVPRGRPEIYEHAHESPRTMLIPIVMLAVGSLFAGMIWYEPFFGKEAHTWFGDALFAGAGNHVLEATHHVPDWVKAAPFWAMGIGLALAWLFYIRNPSIPVRLAAQHHPLYLFLLNKWYFDEIYDFLLVNPAKRAGSILWKRGDLGIIDGTLHAVSMAAIPLLSRLATRFQSGYLFHYAFVMVTGAVLLVVVISILGGGG